MKFHHTFDLTQLDALKKILSAGIIGFCFEKKIKQKQDCIYIFLRNNSVIRIQSELISTEGWDEVGTLTFDEQERDGSATPPMMPLKESWSDISRIDKLIKSKDSLIIESGIRIHAKSGDFFIILPGVFPFTLELKSQFYSGNFDPEFDLKDYEIIELQ